MAQSSSRFSCAGPETDKAQMGTDVSPYDLQTYIDTHANSLGPDEMAHKELSSQFAMLKVCICQGR